MSANDKVAATFNGVGQVDLMGALKASIDRAREARVSPAAEARQRYELAREQSLRDHVTDLLGDVDHFAGCISFTLHGETGCTCLLGRLNWAVAAEELPSAMEVAIEVAAAKANALPQAANHDYLALGTPDGAA